MISFTSVKGKAGSKKVNKPSNPVLPFFYAAGIFKNLRGLFFLLALTAPVIHASAEALPVIARLNTRDTVFRQLLSDVEASRRILFSSRQNIQDAETLVSFLTIFSYVPGEGEALLSIAARCNIPYAALASLNRFSHAEDLSGGNVLLIPSMPGIFVPETPVTDLERLIYSAREQDAVVLAIPRNGKTERFRFIPGDDFSPTERVYFLNKGFHFPLKFFEVSSSYGPRINPVTGRPGIHGGVDLVAPAGSEVYSIKNGIVLDLGVDAVLGKYVIIGHENNLVSLYGHLSSINTSLRAEVQSGSLIARVGSTGQSTGPHLHFELRQDGRSRDPSSLLGIFK